MYRLLVALLALLLIVAPLKASQNALSSPTTGTVSGLQLTNNYNNAIDSLNTRNSGSSAPTNQLSGVPSAGNTWLDTTTTTYRNKVYDGGSWLIPYWLDSTNHFPIVQIGGGTATVASATTTDLCSSVQGYLTISGTTTITGFGSTCLTGAMKVLTFSGILTLTYNATSLIIPGAANVTTGAGDQATVVSLGSGNWQVIHYTPASGTALVNQAVPVGMVVPYGGLSAPSGNYVLGYGQPVSRTTYASLFTAFTSVQSVTRTNGSPTLTGFSDTSQFGYGQVVEGSGITSASTILSVTSTTVTLNNNASSSGTANVTVFMYGNGDGSTTFNVPDCRGRTFVYRDNQGGTAANNNQKSTTITTTVNSTAATVASSNNVSRGQYVISANVPAGTTVSIVNGTAVTLSQNATASASGTAVRFSPLSDVQALGGNGGTYSENIISQEMPSHTHTATVTDPGHTHSMPLATGLSQIPGSGFVSLNSGSSWTFQSNSPSNSSTTGVTVSNSNTGNGAYMYVQNSAIVLNCLVRISRLDRLAPSFAANDNWARLEEAA